MKRALVVDDEREAHHALSAVLEQVGFEVTTALSGGEALKQLLGFPFSVVLLDVRMPRPDGMEVLRRIKQQQPELPVIMMTAYGDVKTAVAAMKMGAQDFITKPIDLEEIAFSVQRATRVLSVRRRPAPPTGTAAGPQGLVAAMGLSAAIRQLDATADRVAQTDFSVVIQGETGTGKELVARAIHERSRRRGRPLVCVDCGAIPSELAESEFFGHTKGAFTGAHDYRQGHFYHANKGTLFLDEISNLHSELQKKFLRVLQERKIRPIGARQDLNVDVRIISASNRDLEEFVNKGNFRRDLYYRLKEFEIRLPPLRERKEDILFLAKRFLEEANPELEQPVRGWSEEAYLFLLDYDYPGNVRELRNMIRSAAILCDGIIEPRHLWGTHRVSLQRGSERRGPIPDTPLSLKEMSRRKVYEFEREIIRRVLEETRGNISLASRLLKTNYRNFYAKVKKYGIKAPGS
ncbi:MAG: sigma-54-dependent transcriptional regulator [Nitrospinota bacterium]